MDVLGVYEQILKDTIDVEMDVIDVLFRAVVLHTHSIALRPDVTLEDLAPSGTPPRIVLAPLTRTHLAELLARLWMKGDRRATDAFWFHEYGSTTPYELFSDIPPELAERAMQARAAVSAHALVADLIEE
jgi:hypothetical protein